MLTNGIQYEFYKEIKKLEDQLSKENLGFTKKEILKWQKKKLQRSLVKYRK